MAITPANFDLLREAFDRAAANKVLLYDIMTERYEITSMLQRELARMPELFGTLQKGTPDQPAVVIESVHHFFKEVAGKPLIRPAWFYDVRQQGEAVPDVGTHLVDAVQWICFPDQALDWRKDVKVRAARHWSTKLTPEQFKRSTGLDQYPDYFKKDIGPDGALEVYANGEVALRLARRSGQGHRSVEIRGPARRGRHPLRARARHPLPTWSSSKAPSRTTNPRSTSRTNTGMPAAQFEQTVRAAVAKLNATWPGVELKPAGGSWEVVIPDKYRVGHEQHFAQVTERFLRYLSEGKMPDWEVPNMLAKYYTTTEAYRLSQRGR